jgi:hypothetical protein
VSTVLLTLDQSGSGQQSLVKRDSIIAITTTSKVDNVPCVQSMDSNVKETVEGHPLTARGAGSCRLRPCCAKVVDAKSKPNKVSCTQLAAKPGELFNSGLQSVEDPRGCWLRPCRHANVKLSLELAHRILEALEEDLLSEEARISILHRRLGFVRVRSHAMPLYSIDKAACESMSSIIRTHDMSLEEATQFVRGEGVMDSRPNKALEPNRLRFVLDGYPHLDMLVQIAENGIDVEWKKGPTPRRPLPKNHGSCRRYLRAITRSFRDGQDTGQYILERWPEVIGSPLGAVEKNAVDPLDKVRTIHDLSYPKDDSVNSAFVADSVPRVRYDSVVIIARRIENLVQAGHAGRIRVLKSNVKTAFRHLRTRANQVFRMAASVKELSILVIFMSAPFGWSGSPPCYARLGRAITWLMGSNSPASVSDSSASDPFFPYEWVDDHILVEPDVDDRLELVEATLRHAMLAVLGPRSINEAKFSERSVEIVALGLKWNTERRTVSIPEDKVVKAPERVMAVQKRGDASKKELFKLLGSLRHVATCLRTAKPFYQRLQSQCSRAPRFGRFQLSAGAKTDLVWFQHILRHGCFAELPVAMFGELPTPDVELYMDASNIGLAVLDPACNSYLQMKFDAEEKSLINQVGSIQNGFSINTREHLSIALAVWTWGLNGIPKLADAPYRKNSHSPDQNTTNTGWRSNQFCDICFCLVTHHTTTTRCHVLIQRLEQPQTEASVETGVGDVRRRAAGSIERS